MTVSGTAVSGLAVSGLAGAGRVVIGATDQSMPGGLSGPQLAERALRLRPGLRLLDSSGYSENPVIPRGRVDPGVPLLNKPDRRQDLAVKLRAVLRES